MKDSFENLLASYNFVYVKGWDITFDGHKIPSVIAEEINNCLGLVRFNFDFLLFFD